MDSQAYPVIRSKADTTSDQFKQNEQAFVKQLDKLRAALAKANDGGGEKYNKRHEDKGKLLPRQRIEMLLDRDAYFLEIAALAANGMSGQTPGAGLVGGVGVVSGVECVITASEATVKGGAVSELGVQKSARISDIAEKNRLPSINLVESAGADLPNQSKIFVPGGRGFRDLTRRSEQKAPTVCLVFGSSTAGGAYIPGMSDYTVMVKEQAQVYLAGPPLVKMATGEDTNHEELGGAEMHSRVSGVSDYFAQNEVDAIRLGREIIAHLNWKKQGPGPSREVEPPKYDPSELLGLVSADVKVPFDVREVIARLTDGSRFSEFKAMYGSTLICGWAFIHGYPIGILGNNGVIFSESANKGAQFIQLCNQSNIPLLFLQNINGFMVGKKYEQEGIIKNGAKLINAVSNSTVPAITIMIGASYGAGNYGMMGRAYDPRFLFTWPNHRISVMGGRQLAGVLDIIQRQAADKKGEKVDEQKLTVMKMMLEQQIENESEPFFATARLWDDGILDPRDTRDVLAICLSIAHNREVQGTTSWGVFRH